MSTTKTLVIKTKNPDSRWVALDLLDNSIIAEGKEPSEVTEIASKTGKVFSLMFVPKEGERYIL